MVSKFISVLILSIFLVGCAGNRTIPVPVEVLVPVPVEAPQPPADAFDLPALSVHELTPESSDEDVSKAYVVSIKILQGFILKLQKYLEVHKKD